MNAFGLSSSLDYLHGFTPDGEAITLFLLYIFQEGIMGFLVFIVISFLFFFYWKKL